LKDAEMADDLYERVEKRAYEIWELEGRPDGAAQRHWDQAMDELAGDDEHETLQDLIDQDDLRDEERSTPSDEVETATDGDGASSKGAEVEGSRDM
jgi:hypothetical protein